MRTWRARWRDMTLASRIVLVMLGLLLVVQAASFTVVRGAVERQVRNGVAAELQLGARVWQRLLDQNAQRLREASAVLAADFGFRSAIASGDSETIGSALENSGARIGASMAVLLDPGFQVVSTSAADAAMAAHLFQRVGTMLAADPQRGRIALVDHRPYQFVMVPVRAPLVIGWVLMGFPINQSLADDFYRLSGVHVAVLATAPGQASEVAVSTLSGHAQQLRQASQSMTADVTVENDVLAARRVPLDAYGGDVLAVFLRSMREATEPFVRLQWMLGLITLGGVVLFALGSNLATRRVTRPLNELTGVTAALERGNFEVNVPGTQRGDELGLLARGFERMRSSLASQRQEILRLAYWDRLTGLPNREQFRDSLKAAIQGGNVGAPLAVITLNVDRFKHVNDVLGYAFGDELLKAVATRLQQLVDDECDIVARLGGDEFAILLARADAAAALALAERIAKAFEAPLAFDDQTVDLSASMGVASWPADATDADTVMSRSEIAMHAAKSKTAGVLAYSPALDSSSTQTLSLLSDLRQALQEGQLRLFLQPKLATASRQVVAAEALVRWQHPLRGLVPPLQFIPFAEQTGFVRQLTLWMFEEAARQWAGLQPAEGHLRIAINLSTRDLLDTEFPQRLEALMRRHGVVASAFCLEITESAIMDDPQRAEATLNKLAEQGFKLSIDDFGTGYSSLAYLKRLPVHELKIDKSFVMAMESDASDAKIVRSTIDLAHNLSLSVVAEGVESQAILDRLEALGCDEAQGYFISKPMPAAEFVAWRERWYAAAPAAASI